MEWTLTRPDVTGLTTTRDAEPLDKTVRQSVVLSRLEDLVQWGRKNSVWPFNFGLSCCYVEMATSITSKFDVSRFGATACAGEQAREAALDRGILENGAHRSAPLRADDGASLGHLDGLLRQFWRHVRHLQRGAGRR